MIHVYISTFYTNTVVNNLLVKYKKEYLKEIDSKCKMYRGFEIIVNIIINRYWRSIMVSKGLKSNERDAIDVVLNSEMQ